MTRSYEVVLAAGVLGLVCLHGAFALAQAPEPHDKPANADAPSSPPAKAAPAPGSTPKAAPVPASTPKTAPAPASTPQAAPAHAESPKAAPASTPQAAPAPAPPADEAPTHGNASPSATPAASDAAAHPPTGAPGASAARAAAVPQGSDTESPVPSPAPARSKRRRASSTAKSSWSHTLEHPFHEGGPDLRRHEGFSFRVGAGVGFGNVSRKLMDGTKTVEGLQGLLHIDVGASVVENLIVYGRLEGFGFNHVPSRDTSDAGNAFFGLIGAGARYYFMPLDWYAGGTVSLAGVLVTNDHDEPSDKAHPGFGISIEGGKDWWAGSRRDLRAFGLGLRLSYVRASPAGKSAKDDGAWVGFGACLVFSAAYN